MGCSLARSRGHWGRCAKSTTREKCGMPCKDNDKYVVVQFAPAVRATLGEEFGMEPGTLVTGKLYAGLRRLGFKQVWDTNFSADLTIWRKGTS